MWIPTEPIGSVLRSPARLAKHGVPAREVTADEVTIGSRADSERLAARELGLTG